ncbi:tRNA pseudouridine(55) synthase TruB [bacterium]|nr:MAG: tRNA pseudouridine(55) synthase TruB [bacterium]
MTSGFLLINKPAGPTSHDIVDKLRTITGIRKIGHAGTLDPFAEGLLVVLIGREATKKQSDFLKKDKEYIATLFLGDETDTYDKTGKIVNKHSGQLPTKDQIKKVLKKFKGEILQTPPIYSAKKIKGKKAYELARKGKEVSLKPSKINIKKLELLRYNVPCLVLCVMCSAGTYIRSLAHDIGRELGCGAYLEKLIRIKSGKFDLKDAIDLDKLTSKNWQKLLCDIDKR